MFRISWRTAALPAGVLVAGWPCASRADAAVTIKHTDTSNCIPRLYHGGLARLAPYNRDIHKWPGSSRLCRYSLFPNSLAVVRDTLARRLPEINAGANTI